MFFPSSFFCRLRRIAIILAVAASFGLENTHADPVVETPAPIELEGVSDLGLDLVTPHQVQGFQPIGEKLELTKPKTPIEKARSHQSKNEISSPMTRPDARVFTFQIPAPRGQILDRNGNPLAQSKVVQYAALRFPNIEGITDEGIVQFATSRIAHANNILGGDWSLPEDLMIAHYRNRRWIPLPFSSAILPEEIEEFERQTMEGLALHSVYERVYPHAKTLSHVIGYVGNRAPRNAGPVALEEPLWSTGVGVDGLEAAFDASLTGIPGRIEVLFSKDGAPLRERILARPTPGFNIVTTIDLEMQTTIEKLLASKMQRGAMVVMDSQNGDIYAMASFPAYDPNEFIPSISHEKFAELHDHPDKPMFPRAFRASYPPASTFKVPVSIAALQTGKIDIDTIYDCPASWKFKDLVMRNWNDTPEGEMNIVSALTRSCNTWFFQAGEQIGSQPIYDTAMALGLGVKTGIPLNAEAAGFVPSEKWSIEKFRHRIPSAGVANMSIGQGYVETTPLQVARMMATIGNRQHLITPRLVKQVQDIRNDVVQSFSDQDRTPLTLDPHHLDIVRDGMTNVVNAPNGTGKQAGHSMLTVAGKTGTGQWKPADNQNVAWFAGFTPAEAPVFAFAVVYEGEPGEGVSGGTKAAPIVGSFLSSYITTDNIARLTGSSGDRSPELAKLGARFAKPTGTDLLAKVSASNTSSPTGTRHRVIPVAKKKTYSSSKKKSSSSAQKPTASPVAASTRRAAPKQPSVIQRFFRRLSGR